MIYKKQLSTLTECVSNNPCECPTIVRKTWLNRTHTKVANQQRAVWTFFKGLESIFVECWISQYLLNSYQHNNGRMSKYNIRTDLRILKWCPFHSFMLKISDVWILDYLKGDYLFNITPITVVFGCNYQKKNDQRKISSESVALLVRRSEKPWFSQI